MHLPRLDIRMMVFLLYALSPHITSFKGLWRQNWKLSVLASFDFCWNFVIVVFVILNDSLNIKNLVVCGYSVTLFFGNKCLNVSVSCIQYMFHA